MRPRGPTKRRWWSTLVDIEASNGDAQLVSKVRRSVEADVRRLGRPDLVDDASLVVSELATNALLHAGGIVHVRVGKADDRIRIEVHDRTRVPPLMARPTEETMTGRGIRLVASLSERWAAEPTAEGKVVWAELAESSRPPALSEDDVFALWDDQDWPDDDQRIVRHRVWLGDVPTSLLLSAKSHIDNLVREFTLAARGADSGVTEQLPAHLAGLVETVVNRFAEARWEIKRQAVVAANQGLSHVPLELNLPADAADAAEEYLRALDEADSYCHAARLLTLETPPHHRVFRHWYVGELVTQLRAAAAGVPVPPPEPFDQRLLAEIAKTAAARQAAERAARLYEASAALARAATHAEVATAVLEQGVAALGASGGGVLLATDADHLIVPGTVGYDDDVVRQLRSESKEAELPAAVALRTGEAVWIESLEDRDRRFPELLALERRTVSICAVPLAIGDRRLGALRFSFRRPRLFDEDERRFVLALAAQTAQALDRTQLVERRLDFSRRLQLSLLPRRVTSPPNVQIAGIYHALGDGMELGGDIYDVWAIDERRWGVAIADASGTGPEAAALTAMVRFTLRALTVADADPPSVLTKLNRALLETEVASVDDERFCTGLFGLLVAGTPPVVMLAGGGHPSPIVRRADGRLEEITVGGSLLGLLEDATVGSVIITLEPGETLVLYTDGAIEARHDGVMFGVEGVMAAIAAAPPGAETIAEAIETAVLRHTGGTVSDDLAALVIHVPR